MKRLIGFLGWIGVALVAAAVVIRFTQPELQEWSQRLAIAGLVATLLYTLGQWRDITRSFQARNVRYGSIAAGSVVVFIGILIGVNWIANRQNKRWDLTSTQQFSLSDQSKKVVTSLTQPVQVKVFHSTEDVQRFRDRLAEYQYLSPQLQVEYFDVEKQPLDAQRYEVQQFGTIVFEYDGRRERTTSDTEQDITNALIKVIEGKAKKVYFVQGHGERDSAGADPRGYSQIAEALKSDNFEVGALALAQDAAVPEDATLVVIAGPTSDYLPGEIELLKGYLDRAGNVLLMIDPIDRQQSASVPNLIALAKTWGVDVGNNIVVDASGLGRAIGAGPEVPLAMSYPAHPITSNFRVMTAFPLSRSITPVEGGSDGRTAQTIVETSPRSWAETDVAGLFATGKPELDPATDKTGPISIAAAVTAAAANAPAPAEPDAPKAEARLVVVGDSDFGSNGAQGIQGNGDLFLNMANWLAQQENLIAIRPRDPGDSRLSLTEDQSQRIFWLALVLIPLALVGVGVRVWWKRR
ncbi:MAG: GldG family protein [Acidobacteria bacterium]|nr:GldG family protein [Acidobacteriota bacterium]